MDTNRILFELDQKRRDFEFVQPGLLLCESSDIGRKQLQQQVELQNEIGLPSTFLEPEDVPSVHPEVRTDDLTGATFCPTSGYYDAYSACAAFVDEAESLGASAIPGTRVTDIEISRNAVENVVTDVGEIATDVVVNATGIWGKRLAKMVGIDLPTIGIQHQGFTTDPVPELEGLPMVEDFTAAFWFGSDPGGGISMGTFRDDPDMHDVESLDWDFSRNHLPVYRDSLIDYLLPDVVHRLPVMEKAGLRHEWSGLTCFTPDRAPILGEHPSVTGFINQLGFSAHGITHGPSSGKQIAETIVDGQSSIDLSPYSIERFGDDVELSKELYTEYFDREKTT